MSYLDSFAIYNPRPDYYVFVPWRSETGREPRSGRVQITETLEEARALLPMHLGLVRFDPSPEDPEDLVEAWI